MADSITRCPKCHTSFRITQAHLSSAKGAVRCGSCLNIFNAKEHLVAPGEEPTPAASAPTKKPARPLTNKPKTAKPTNRGAAKSAPAVAPKPVPKPVPAAQNIRDDDDILISDDMDIDDNLGVEDDQFSHDHHDNIIYSKSLSSTKSNLFERTEEDDKDKNDENKPDESWALSLLEDSEDDTPLPSFRKDSSKHVAVEDVQRASRHTATGEYRAVTEPTPTPEEDEAQAFITENYPEMPPEQVEEELRRNTSAHQPVFTTMSDETQDEYAEREPEPDFSQPLIHAIEPEPVEFSYARSYTLLESNWLWAPLTLVAAITLIGLLAWVNFDHYSRISPYRSYYSNACSVIGCELPALVSRKDIRAVNLVVRSHPTVAGAFIVDAVLQNTAEFDQPFPSLDLVFTDVGNKPVAARRFHPAEYLAGEMAGKTQMPSQKSVHIVLEIVDPGPDAVGYRIEIAK